MAKTKAAIVSDPPETVVVYPSQAMIARGENLAGVGVNGAEVSAKLAKEWLDAGLATLEPPASEEE